MCAWVTDLHAQFAQSRTFISRVEEADSSYVEVPKYDAEIECLPASRNDVLSVACPLLRAIGFPTSYPSTRNCTAPLTARGVTSARTATASPEYTVRALVFRVTWVGVPAGKTSID